MKECIPHVALENLKRMAMAHKEIAATKKRLAAPAWPAAVLLTHILARPGHPMQPPGNCNSCARCSAGRLIGQAADTSRSRIRHQDCTQSHHSKHKRAHATTRSATTLLTRSGPPHTGTVSCNPGSGAHDQRGSCHRRHRQGAHGCAGSSRCKVRGQWGCLSCYWRRCCCRQARTGGGAVHGCQGRVGRSCGGCRCCCGQAGRLCLLVPCCWRDDLHIRHRQTIHGCTGRDLLHHVLQVACMRSARGVGGRCLLCGLAACSPVTKLHVSDQQTPAVPAAQEAGRPEATPQLLGSCPPGS